MDDYSNLKAIIELAKDWQDKLAKAKVHIVQNNVSKKLSAAERQAFFNRDTCAIDRLTLLRAYHPGLPTYLNGKLKNRASNTVGKIPSPTLEFVALYRKYHEEKEGLSSSDPTPR